MIRLSRVVVVQDAARGIGVNIVVPGQEHTQMVEARLAGQRAGGGIDVLVMQRNARVPLAFAGDRRDTADAAPPPASDEARPVTRKGLVVDGGIRSLRVARQPGVTKRRACASYSP